MSTLPHRGNTSISSAGESAPQKTFFSDYPLIYVVVILLMVALLLGWQGYSRLADFRLQQEQIAATSVAGAANEIMTKLFELRRAVGLFAGQQARLLNRLAREPLDDEALVQLEAKVHTHFPDVFAFASADGAGEILVESELGLVSEVCQRDLKDFVTEFEHQHFIHPNPEQGYHFDVMVPWQADNGEQGIFFVSFLPDALARLLANSQTLGHQLMLVLRGDPRGLIEVSAGGSRDALERAMVLSAAEHSRIAASMPIPGTRWELVDIIEPGLYKGEMIHAGSQVVGIFLVFVVVSAFMLRLIKQEERKRESAEASLRSSEERYHDLYENLPDMYFTVATDGTVLSVNQSGVDCLGYSRVELVGHGVWKVVHPQDVGRVKAQVARIVAQQLPGDELEFRKVSKDDSALWVHARARLIAGDGDSAPELCIVCRDITDLRRAREKMRHHEQELAHVDRLSLMGELASSLAHELNQPLGAVTNYAKACLRMVHKGNRDIGKLSHALEQTVDQARRAGEIIRRIREFVRKEGRPRECVDLDALIRETLDFIATELKHKSVTVHTALAAGLPKVRCDRIQIEQVLLNLTFNSIEAIDQAGSNAREIAIGLQRKGETLQVRVSDTGPGLNQNARQHMFDPFFSTKPNGMGMGLAISRSIIEAHAGHLWAESGEHGTTFQFALPISEGCL